MNEITPEALIKNKHILCVDEDGNPLQNGEETHFIICNAQGEDLHQVKINRSSCSFFGLQLNDTAIHGDEESRHDTSAAKWTAQETKYMLSLYSEMAPHVGKTYALKSRRKMWQAIAEAMKEEGCTFNAVQIENRYKTLDRGYKDKTVTNKKTGRARASCDFESELNEINRNKKSVFPEYTLSSEGGQSAEEFRNNVLAENTHTDQDFSRAINIICSENANINECSSEASMKTPRSRSAADELKKLNKTKDDELELKKTLVELEREKLSAYKQRTLEIKRKNDLFEFFIEKCT